MTDHPEQFNHLLTYLLLRSAIAVTNERVEGGLELERVLARECCVVVFLFQSFDDFHHRPCHRAELTLNRTCNMFRHESVYRVYERLWNGVFFLSIHFWTPLVEPVLRWRLPEPATINNYTYNPNQVKYDKRPLSGPLFSVDYSLFILFRR